MNFLQVMASGLGMLKPDPDKITKQIEIFRREYPHAVITVKDGCVKAKAFVAHLPCSGDIVHCMKCGEPMVDRCNQTVKKGKWVPLKRKNNMSNWECPNCRPLKGFEPLATWNDSCYEDLTEEQVIEKAQSFRRENEER